MADHLAAAEVEAERLHDYVSGHHDHQPADPVPVEDVGEMFATLMMYLVRHNESLEGEGA